MGRARFVVEMDVDPVPVVQGQDLLQAAKKRLELVLDRVSHYNPSVEYAEGTGGYYSELVICDTDRIPHPLWDNCINARSPLLWKDEW